jgi:hydroxypyruvate reductase
MKPEEYRRQLTEIFKTAVERVNPETMISRFLSLQGNILKVDLPESPFQTDLSRFDRIVILGTGKATAKMALALEKVLGSRINDGFISVKTGHTEPLSLIRIQEASHPVPDESSVAAAREMERLAREADERTLVINLISGGGSALLCSPYADDTYHLTLSEKQEVTRQLLACGADISEINCLRKHLSGIKGGRLAALLAPATSLNLILSDVIGDALSAIASGPTTADPTTFGEAATIVEKYRLWDKIPAAAAAVIRAGLEGKIPETPKPGDRVFEKVTNILIGTNRDALITAAEKARALGYNSAVLTCRLAGEAKEAARLLFDIAGDIRDHGLLASRPACLLAGGETTVTLKGSGLGGRNQEMALAFLDLLSRDPQGGENLFFLSGGTDGNDGPTDAAGAFADSGLIRRSEELGLNPGAYLENNDSYHFFEAADGLLKTGPTNTNVCDLQIILIP